MKLADRKAMPKPIPVVSQDQIRMALTLELRELRRRKADRRRPASAIARRIREIETALGIPEGEEA